MKSLPDRIRQIANRIHAFFRPAAIDNDLNQEMTSHLEFAIEENLQRGLSLEAARRQALIRFGGLQQARERHREARGLPRIETFLQDLRYAVRVLKKSPIFTTVAVLTLGFGIGLNTTLFSVVNVVALKPVPVRDSNRIVRMERWFVKGSHGDIQYRFSDDEFRYVAEHNRVFSSVMATSFPIRVAASLPLDAASARVTKALVGPPENATAQMVSANYLAELGVTPALGRVLR